MARPTGLAAATRPACRPTSLASVRTQPYGLQGSNLSIVVLWANSIQVGLNRHPFVSVRFVRFSEENRLTPTNTDLVGHRQNWSQNKDRFCFIPYPVFSPESVFLWQRDLSPFKTGYAAAASIIQRHIRQARRVVLCSLYERHQCEAV
jgi:hypothetical protein